MRQCSDPSWVCEIAVPDHDQILTQANETPEPEAVRLGSIKVPKISLETHTMMGKRQKHSGLASLGLPFSMSAS